MPLKCPTCAQQYDQGLQCPRCRVSLIPWAQADLENMDPVPPHWTRNPWGRTVLGVILAQGIYLGLKNLLLAGYLAAEEQGNDAVLSYYHLFSTQALQLIALLIGSLFAGAGQRSGFLFGGLVGVWNAIILTLVYSVR